jgi:glutaredoxin 3
MAHIKVYSGPACPYCDKAKALLTRKNAPFEEFNVKADVVKLEEMLELSGGRKTIPQIFIDGKHIGGCDDLYALESAGELDKLLAT